MAVVYGNLKKRIESLAFRFLISHSGLSRISKRGLKVNLLNEQKQILKEQLKTIENLRKRIESIIFLLRLCRHIRISNLRKRIERACCWSCVCWALCWRISERELKGNIIIANYCYSYTMNLRKRIERMAHREAYIPWR